MSTVVVSDGNDSGSGQGYGGAVKVIAVIAALGLAAYFLLPKLQEFLSGLSTSWGQGGTSYGGGSYAAATPSASGSTVGRQVVQAGQYTVPGVDNTVRTGTGLGNLFVNTGPGTPANFFPSGAVITTSRELSAPEQATVLQNLISGEASKGITNAWWQPATITQTKQPGGVNSGGSYQSNIPLGTKHCPCTDALRKSGVCRPNDDWYYC